MGQFLGSMETLSQGRANTVGLLAKSVKAYKVVDCECYFLPKYMRKHVVTGYIPKGATIVRPHDDGIDFVDGNALLTSEFVPASINTYLPFMKCYGDRIHKSDKKIRYIPDVPIRVKPHTNFEALDAKGIYVFRTLDDARMAS
jgi:hypothetical protein